MKLSNYLSERTALIEITAEDKTGAIEALISAAAKMGFIKDEAGTKKAVLEREKAISTALGQGVALPHAKMKGLEDFIVIVGRLKEPVEFGAPDGEPVEVLVLILSPENRTVDHVKLMADVTKQMKFTYVRQAILDSSSGAEVLRALEKE